MKQTWNTKGMRKWTMSEALELTTGQVLKMKIPERAELAAFFQSQLKRRVATYKRAKTHTEPQAYRTLMNNFKELSEVADYGFDFNAPIIEAKGRKHTLSPEYAALEFPQHKLLSYIVQLQNFFTSKTSTISGWRDSIRNNSISLFGGKEYTRKGKTYIKPNHVMSEEEYDVFWRLYSEIRKSGRTVIYDSEAMRETGYTRIWREKYAKGEWNFDDLTGMMNDMLDELKKSGQFVREFPEYVPGNSSNPFQQDPDGDGAFELFQW